MPERKLPRVVDGIAITPVMQTPLCGSPWTANDPPRDSILQHEESIANAQQILMDNFGLNPQSNTKLFQEIAKMGRVFSVETYLNILRALVGVTEEKADVSSLPYYPWAYEMIRKNGYKLHYNHEQPFTFDLTRAVGEKIEHRPYFCYVYARMDQSLWWTDNQSVLGGPILLEAPRRRKGK